MTIRTPASTDNHLLKSSHKHPESITPLLTHPMDFALCVCFASLNDDAGIGFCMMEAGAGALLVAVGVWGDNMHELMGFRKSLLVSRGALVDVKGVVCNCNCSISLLTMAIGIQHHFGGMVVEEEEDGEKADADVRGVKTSMGPEHCATITPVREVEHSGTSKVKRSREMNILSCLPSSHSG
jgi:hypothetical protein